MKRKKIFVLSILLMILFAFYLLIKKNSRYHYQEIEYRGVQVKLRVDRISKKQEVYYQKEWIEFIDLKKSNTSLRKGPLEESSLDPNRMNKVVRDVVEKSNKINKSVVQ